MTGQMASGTIQPFQGVWPKIGPRVYIADSSVVIGEVTLGDDVSVWPMTAIRGDVNRIEIGNATNLQDGSVLHVTQKSQANPDGFPLIVGRGVTVGHRAVLHACTVGDFCLIGTGAIVLDGAIIEERAMVGAGALVPPGKRLEGGFLYVGSPARQARPLRPDELAFLEISASGYVRLKDAYLFPSG
ncbi:MAG: gamma carbonic anhydrase family protein [Methylotetracoccus sp.]